MGINLGFRRVRPGHDRGFNAILTGVQSGHKLQYSVWETFFTELVNRKV